MFDVHPKGRFPCWRNNMFQRGWNHLDYFWFYMYSLGLFGGWMIIHRSQITDDLTPDWAENDDNSIDFPLSAKTGTHSPPSILITWEIFSFRFWTPNNFANSKISGCWKSNKSLILSASCHGLHVTCWENLGGVGKVWKMEIYLCLAILCDRFGMAKWPCQWLSDLQLGDKKVTTWITWWYLLGGNFRWNPKD